MFSISTKLYSFLLLVVAVRWETSHAYPLVYTTSNGGGSWTKPSSSSSSVVLLHMSSMNLKELPGCTPPFTNGFDPLRLSTVGSDATLSWFRAAELKHSRCAMLAITGYIVQRAGIHFPGYLSSSSDISFESISNTYTSPIEQWNAVPDAGKYQIIALILMTEIATEAKKPHYMMEGGSLPTIVFPEIDFSKVDPATLTIKRSRELNNGRLAMITIMAYISDYCIPGSVPILV